MSWDVSRQALDLFFVQRLAKNVLPSGYVFGVLNNKVWSIRYQEVSYALVFAGISIRPAAGGLHRFAHFGRMRLAGE